MAYNDMEVISLSQFTFLEFTADFFFKFVPYINTFIFICLFVCLFIWQYWTLKLEPQACSRHYTTRATLPATADF
jgi:hypothetical protein